MQRGQIVEYGTSRQVLHNPQHEYTRKLIDAIPKLAAAPVLDDVASEEVPA